jgi:hypothetical protein
MQMRGDSVDELTGGCLCGSVRDRSSALTYWHAGWPQEISITIATLDNPALAVPADHTWMAHAVGWDAPADGLPQFATDRPG